MEGAQTATPGPGAEWARCPGSSLAACQPSHSPAPLTPADHRRRESSLVLEQPRKCRAGPCCRFRPPRSLRERRNRERPAGAQANPARSAWPRPLPADPLLPGEQPRRRARCPGTGCVRPAGAAGADSGRWKNRPSGRVRWEAWAAQRAEVRPGGASGGFSRVRRAGTAARRFKGIPAWRKVGPDRLGRAGEAASCVCSPGWPDFAAQEEAAGETAGRMRTSAWPEGRRGYGRRPGRLGTKG